MSIEIKVGQVWQDKDKRRDTRIEIIAVPSQKQGDAEATGLVVGTEETRTYQLDRLVKRWKLIKEAAEPVKAPAKPKYKTREQWLLAAVDLLTKKLFKPNDFTVPEVRVSVGWPGGRGKKTGVRGQCFPTSAATDSMSQIFISPDQDDPVTVLGIVAHELIHAVDDCKSAHVGNFVRIAKVIGFLPKWTSSDNRTDALLSVLNEAADKLGPYPHAAIQMTQRPTVQKTYMMKVVCKYDEEYFVRMTQTKLDDFGAPLCPCHNKEMEVEEK